MKYHEPVLVNEILEYLNVENGKKYIDATLGDGGHTLEILKLGGHVLGFDYSEQSLKRATQRIKSEGLGKNFTGVYGNFRKIEEVAKQSAFAQADGIIFDLGFSSFHMDEAGIGLSYQKDEPLDMRLDKALGLTAADLINSLSAKQLEWAFTTFGEEGLAKKFAKKIVERRELKKFSSTKDLHDFLVEIAPPGYDRGKVHPARRVFQALRIAVNDELTSLEETLPRAARLLTLPGGRMAIISFHSLEDRMAKHLGQKVRPEINLVALTKKPVQPTKEETRRNRRARSAKLRVYERQG